MGGEYRLVSEDEWQQLQSNLKWYEAEAARLEKEGLRLESEVYNLRWQYSHEDPNADEPECKGEWVGDREWESEPREACDCSPLSEVCEAGPQRPHESLVWATFYASPECRGVDEADAMLEAWRERWPEPEG